jgi:hypothetical protein
MPVSVSRVSMSVSISSLALSRNHRSHMGTREYNEATYHSALAVVDAVDAGRRDGTDLTARLAYEVVRLHDRTTELRAELSETQRELVRLDASR